MSDVSTIYLQNDMVIEIADLLNEVDGQNINNATVTVTVTDTQGNNVTGSIWPMTMQYVPESKGVYRTVLPQSLNLVKNQRYLAKINVTNSEGLKGYWEIELVCKTRK